MPAYSAPCTQGPPASHHDGPRAASVLKWCVLHSAEASDDSGPDTTAEGVAAFFHRPDATASTQLAVDRDSCVRMLPDLVIPWGATGANTAGLHVEICGRAGWTTEQWMARPTMLDRAAFKVAKWCSIYSIPARYVGPLGLRLGRRGITTHKDVNAAFRKGSHWDPGPNFPRAYFLARVKAHLAAIEAGKL